MRIALTIWLTDETIGPTELARAAEARGFAGLYFPDHTHQPVGSSSPHPRGVEQPREHARLYDPFVAMAAAAAVTTGLLVGTSVCLTFERDPIATAKAVASVDHLSGGRVRFGVGAGWNHEEMRNHGVVPERRFDQLREHVLAMREIWANDEASFDGEIVSFGPLRQWPKPVQRPGPPVYVGGNARQAIERALEYGDGWMPVASGVGSFPEQLAVMRRRAAEIGRQVPVIAFGPPATAAALDELGRLGIDDVVLTVPAAASDVVMPALDGMAALVDRFS